MIYLLTAINLVTSSILRVCQLNLSKVLVGVKLRACIHQDECTCVYMSFYICTLFKKNIRIGQNISLSFIQVSSLKRIFALGRTFHSVSFKFPVTVPVHWLPRYQLTIVPLSFFPSIHFVLPSTTSDLNSKIEITPSIPNYNSFSF
jgi:hypothetical protein